MGYENELVALALFYNSYSNHAFVVILIKFLKHTIHAIKL